MRKIIFILSILIMALTSSGRAEEICPLTGKPMGPQGVRSLESFRSIAVLNQGRVKPLDTYAESLLLQLSGKRSVDREKAIHWLARLLFSPDTTMKDKVFLINNPDIAQAIGIKAEEHRRYSFSQLEPGFPKLEELNQAAQSIESKERSLVESEIIRVYQNIVLYTGLYNAFKFTVPSDEFTVSDPDLRKQLDLPENPSFSFLEIALKADKLKPIADRLAQKREDQWTAQDKEVVNLLTNLYNGSLSYRDIQIFIIPTASGGENWMSPWDALSTDFTSPVVKQELIALANMFFHYWNGEQLKFDMSVEALNASVKNRVSEKEKYSTQLIPLEIFYNNVNPFLWAKIGYGLALLLILLALGWNNSKLQMAGFVFAVLGFIPHALALLLRIIIMARPPVSNLYETFIFVAFISVVAGFLIERFDRKGLGIVVSSICGLVFLLISGKFSAEGDTMQMLVAVLNSNFWLGTHVLSITTGYAGVCTAGVVGHIYILQQILRPADKKAHQQTYRFLVATLGFGLTMTFLGTNLGGIWADQSWGRFWGWDPKENGALMIILWTAMIFHAKIARLIDAVGVAVGSILGIVVVMWAWFGVNLLSVGLHSYGFTSGVALGLAIYVALQSVFLAICIPILKTKLKHVS